MQLKALCVVVGFAAAQAAIDPSSAISLLLAPHATPETHPEVHDDLNSPHMAPVAGALQKLLEEEGGVASKANQALIDTMNEVLNVTMRGRLYEADASGQAAIDAAFADIGACAGSHYNYSLLATSNTTAPQDQQWIGALPSWYDHHFDSYAQCKRFEDEVLKNVNNCTSFCLNETTQVCVENPTCSANQCNEPTLTNGPAYRNFLLGEISRIHSLINATENPTSNCTTHINDAQSCYINCMGIVAPLLPGENQTLSCCAAREEAETMQCRTLLNQRRDWLLYESCYNSAVANYNAVLAEQQGIAVSRKAQMRSIRRMLCLVDSFGPDQNTKLPQCIAARYYDHPDVLAMNVTGHNVSAKIDEFTCSAGQLPGSAEWDAAHYTGLPTGMEVCPEVNCQAACNTTSEHYVATWNLTLASMTTTTTTLTLGNIDCIRQTSSLGVQWDMHAVHTPTVTANLGSGMFSIFIYIQNGLSSDSTSPTMTQCGILTSVVSSVNCAHVAPAGGQYLRLYGAFNGVVTSGTADPGWCSMTIDGSPAPEPTTGGYTTTATTR